MNTTWVVPKIHLDTCTGCTDCVEVCHVDALAIQEMKVVFVKAADAITVPTVR